MQLTFADETALAILRGLRARRRPLPRRTDLHEPDPAPGKRWAKSLVAAARERAGADGGELVVCVGSQTRRVRAAGVRSLVHSGEYPRGAFLELGDGFYASGPELVFLEQAGHLSLPELVLLGLELCGCFSRDPRRARDGAAQLGVAPVTNVSRLAAFLAGVRGAKGLGRARQALRYLADDAWSPMEAVVAAMMMLPLEEYGYGFGRCRLNVRIDTREAAIGPGDKAERVPDILVEGTRVGINYDGALHLDLGAVVDAAVELGRHPESSRAESFTEGVVAQVRAKAVDDIRRNRALEAAGLTVYPVVKEDLHEKGALDGVMWQVMLAIEAQTKRSYPLLREALTSSFAQEERYRLLASMLPGKTAPVGDAKVDEAFVRLPNRRCTRG